MDESAEDDAVSEGRELWIDRCKGALILLVVLGHAIGTGRYLGASDGIPWMNFAYQYIYAFHMPAFFLLAGVTWRTVSSGTAREFAAFAGKKARRLLVPYLVFGLASIVFYLLFASASYDALRTTDGYYAAKGGMSLGFCLKTLVCASGWPDGQGFAYNSVLWFLPALFTLEIAYWVVDRFLPRRIPQLVIGIAALMLGWVVSHSGCFYLPWGLGRLPMNLVYFLIGRWFVPLSAGVALSRPRRILSGLALAGCAALLGFLCWTAPNPWVCAFKVEWHLAYAAMAVVGALLCVAAARLFDVKAFASLGLCSLGIMLMHKFVVMAGFKLAAVREMFAGSAWIQALSVLLLTAVATSVSVAATVVLRRWWPEVIGERRRR